MFVLVLCSLFSSIDPLFAASACQWSGKGATNRWSDAGNWNTCGAGTPTKGDTLTFPAGALKPVNENDIQGLIVDAVDISGLGAGGARYDISGAALEVSGSIRVASPLDASGSGTVLRLPVAMLGKAIRVETSLSMLGPLTASEFVKNGAGTLILFNTANNWKRLILVTGFLRLGVAGALPDAATLSIAGFGTLQLADFNETTGTLDGSYTAKIELGSGTLTVRQAKDDYFDGAISGTGGFVKQGEAMLTLSRSKDEPAPPNTYTGMTIVNEGVLSLGKAPGVNAIAGPVIVRGGVLRLIDSDQLDDAEALVVNAPGAFDMRDMKETIGSLAGTGGVVIGAGRLAIGADDTSTTFSGVFTGSRTNREEGEEAYHRIVKIGAGVLTLTGNSTPGQLTVVERGELVLNGRLNGAGVLVRDGMLSGTGTILDVSEDKAVLTSTLMLASGTIAPGDPIGTLRADAAQIREGELAITLGGTAPGGGYSQLELTDTLSISKGAQLAVARGTFGPPAGATFTIVRVNGVKPIDGTFSGLAEGSTLMVGGQKFSISYRGGKDMNDIVLTALEGPPPITYFLSEGATGEFFDDDVLIANPSDAAAPVTLMFSKENGAQVVTTRIVPAKSRLTVHVDSIPGLEASAFSVRVRSDAGVPLAVERSMFWDKSHYAGHTGAAVDKPGTDWFFAEGAQGFFETFVLVINPNDEPAEVALTFMLENERPVIKNVRLDAFARLTVHAGEIPELRSRAFGIAVHASKPIMAERAMYFGTTPGRLWSGGHESAGVTRPSTDWFLAEGATGEFFDTFVLLSNPQKTPANVTLRYLLATGETVTVPKTIAANARLTTNIEAEEDTRLRNAAVSTVVSSDVPIIAERSMYWQGRIKPWAEAHNSFGVVRPDVSWALAEGRAGGDLNFHTFILLANPAKTAAEVTVTFLREHGAPIVQTYTVAATSRFNIDTGSVSGLEDETFGALISVTNDIPIIVERSMYWGPPEAPFTGGTNATGIALSEVP